MRAFTLTHVLHRLLAGFGVALVLALTVFAASPQLHSWLHADTAAGDDDCPVAVFAGGVSAPASPLVVHAPVTDWKAPAYVSVDELFLAWPRYLHQPERGPPAC